MDATSDQTPWTITRWPKTSSTESADHLTLIAEEPLSIRVQGQPFVVVMRTPGHEKAHAAGLCLAEGVVDTPEDIANLALCDGPADASGT